MGKMRQRVCGEMSELRDWTTGESESRQLRGDVPPLRYIYTYIYIYIYIILPPPCSYEATYRRFAREGARVLALAWRAVPAPAPPISKLRGLRREEAEAGLSFAGFAVFHCPW